MKTVIGIWLVDVSFQFRALFEIGIIFHERLVTVINDSLMLMKIFFPNNMPMCCDIIPSGKVCLESQESASVIVHFHLMWRSTSLFFVYFYFFSFFSQIVNFSNCWRASLAVCSLPGLKSHPFRRDKVSECMK